MIEISLRVFQARRTGNTYEKQRMTDVFRVPFVVPAPKASKMGGFQKWRYPEMDGLQGTSYENGWFGGTPILGNLQMGGLLSSRMGDLTSKKVVIWHEWT